MTILQSIVLGIVQGLTEFLPISSTAHLLLTQYLFGWEIPDQQAFIFNVLVQLGTLLALVIYFWKDIVAILTSALKVLLKEDGASKTQANLGWYLILSTIPAVLFGILLKSWVEQLFTNEAVAAVIRLLMTAILLVIAEKISKQIRQFDSITWKDALWTGFFQVLSIFPGASRSGSTITGGMTRHLNRSAAARFAFLMAIPVMLAAGISEIIDLLQTPNWAEFLPHVIIGFITAAVVGYAAIHWLLRYLAHRSLYIFAAYCLVLSGVILVMLVF
jgi:undecaprenyl-diphosphatase